MINIKHLAVRIIVDWMINNPDKGLRLFFKNNSPYTISNDKSEREAYLEFYNHSKDMRTAGINYCEDKYIWSSYDFNKAPIFCARTVTGPEKQYKGYKFNGATRFLIIPENYSDSDIIITNSSISFGDLVVDFKNAIDIKYIKEIDND